MNDLVPKIPVLERERKENVEDENNNIVLYFPLFEIKKNDQLSYDQRYQRYPRTQV